MNRFRDDILSPLCRNSSTNDSSDVSETNVFDISNLNFNLTSFADTRGTGDILSPIDSVFLAENLRDTAGSSKKISKFQFSPEDFATKPERSGEIESYSSDQNDIAKKYESENIYSTSVSSNNSYSCLNIKSQSSNFENLKLDKAAFSKDKNIFTKCNLANDSEYLQKEYKSINGENFDSNASKLNLAQVGRTKRPTSLFLRDELAWCGEATTVLEKSADESSKDISSDSSYKSCAQDCLEKQLRILSLDSEINAHVLESASETWKKDKSLLDFMDKKSNFESQDTDSHESSSGSADSDGHKSSLESQDTDHQESSSEFQDTDYWKNRQNLPKELASGLSPYEASIEKMVHDCVSEECAKLRQIMFINKMGFYRQLNKMKQEMDYNHFVLTERLFNVIEELMRINSMLTLQLES